MTKDKDEKAVIRARMARTGESYAAARAQLARPASPDGAPADAPEAAARMVPAVGVPRFSEPSLAAIRLGRTPEATAWDLLMGLARTNGLAGQVLAELDVRAPARPGEGPAPGDMPFHESWTAAARSAMSLARQAGDTLIDSGLLLRGAVAALEADPSLVPADSRGVMTRLASADLVALLAAACEHTAETAETRTEASERTGMFERFTDKARRVIVMAQEEARALEHNYIGTEHLLLGLLDIDDAIAAKVLSSLGVDSDRTRAEVEAIVGRGTEPPSGHIPFTPRAKATLEQSLRAALRLGHNYIGTEHILLGLTTQEEGVAMRVLQEKAGVTADSIEAKVTEALTQLEKDKRPDPDEPA